MYTALIYAHILSAIASVGPFFVLLPLPSRMKQARGEVLTSQIATFKSAIRIVKHAGHVLVLTGVLLIWQGPWNWSAPWIVATLALMGASIVFLARAFSPVLKRFEERDADYGAITRKLFRSLWLYLLILLVLLWLMVDKPLLW